MTYPRNILSGATVAVLLLAMGCMDTPTAPGPTRSKSVRKSLTGNLPSSMPLGPTVTDWYNCVSDDAGMTFSCSYAWTDYSGSDYWDANTNAWYTQSNCSNYRTTYCDQTLRSGPSRRAASTYISNGTSHDIAVAQPLPPQCNAPIDAKDVAWCNGLPLTTARVSNIHSAIARIAARGGNCALIAQALTSAERSGWIHVFSGADNRFKGFTAAAPKWGHSRGVDWVAVADTWVDTYYDGAHNTITTATDAHYDRYGPRNLDQILAHEGDHLIGADHIPGAPDKTPNSQACSGLP